VRAAPNCLIEYPRGALRVSVASGPVGWALELPAVACRVWLTNEAAAHRISPRCGSKEVRERDPPESGVPTVVLANCDRRDNG
jgi:hypothetical protein